jgi:hypothetical protein
MWHLYNIIQEVRPHALVDLEHALNVLKEIIGRSCPRPCNTVCYVQRYAFALS